MQVMQVHKEYQIRGSCIATSQAQSMEIINDMQYSCCTGLYTLDFPELYGVSLLGLEDGVLHPYLPIP